MWAGVRQRFGRFHAGLRLTPDQREDGLTKQLGVRKSLQRAYYGTATDAPPGFIVGSWGKDTAVRPPQDVDVFFELPLSVLSHFQSYSGNQQSALLQSVREILRNTYSQTHIRGDGQVVMVQFNTITIEVVPVFRFDSQGRFIMPDTNAGGRWKLVEPIAELSYLDSIDRGSNGNSRAMAQMLKVWKRQCNVPLKSYQLELLVAEFMNTYHYRVYDYFWYDWFFRDFFIFLCKKAWTSLYNLSTGDHIFLGDDWLSRAKSARDRALKACHYEREDLTIIAGEEWQKIFGNQIPIHVI